MYCVQLIWYRCMQINSIFSIINISNKCCAIIILSHTRKRRSKAESSLTYLLISFLLFFFPSFLPSFFLGLLPWLPSFLPSFLLSWLPSLTSFLPWLFSLPSLHSFLDFFPSFQTISDARLHDLQLKNERELSIHELACLRFIIHLIILWWYLIFICNRFQLWFCLF